MPIRQKRATFSTIQNSDLSPDGSQIGRPPPGRIFRLVPPPLHCWHHGGQRHRPGFRTKAATACATFELPGPYLHKCAFAWKSNTNTPIQLYEHTRNYFWPMDQSTLPKTISLFRKIQDTVQKRKSGCNPQLSLWFRTFIIRSSMFFLSSSVCNQSYHTPCVHLYSCRSYIAPCTCSEKMCKSYPVSKNAHVLFCVHCAQDLV